ncbi:MAG: AtpZ/AtpI family protein [Patescibacteria group bacterium]|jgi:F0F1-type ATP synthase assembly protein I
MNEREQQLSAFQMAMQLGFTISVPLVALALLGRVLDNRFDTHPWLLITGIVVSMVVSSILVVWKAFKLMKDVTSNQDSEKDKRGDGEKK